MQGLPRRQTLRRLQQLQVADSSSTALRRVCELFARLCFVVCYCDFFVLTVECHLDRAEMMMIVPQLLLVADDVSIFVFLLTVAPVAIE